jgi:3-oxoadipate enol-lactonase
MSQTTFCEIPAGRIAYSRRGMGRPLVLLHPIGVDRSWWNEYVGHWASSYDVIAIDIRGHGESSAVTAPITLADHATDVAAVLRQERVTGATLIGVSMGGMIDETITRWFAADTPRPDLVQTCRERLAADDWYSWSANWRAISLLDNLGELPGVKVPALVVAGDADASIPPAVSQKIADALPDSRFVVVPGAAHFGAFDMRDVFATVFDDFLSTLAR